MPAENGSARPPKTPRPSCSIIAVLPCTGTGARTTRPPNAAPIAWWPRHTPSTGTASPKRRMTSSVSPASSGRPGPGEITTCVGCIAAISSIGHLVVPPHRDRRPELAQVLHQVVGERVVVIENEDHVSSKAPLQSAHRPARPAPAPAPAAARPFTPQSSCASSSARTSARALSRVSSYSADGFESATMPAPAWR